MRKGVKLSRQSKGTNQILGAGKLFDDFVAGIFLVAILERNLSAIGKKNQPEREFPCGIPGPQLLCVVLRLSNQVWIVERNFLAFGFNDTSGLAVNQQDVIRFKPAAHQRLSDSDRSHIGFVLVSVDHEPAGFLKLSVNPDARYLFWFHLVHTLLPV